MGTVTELEAFRIKRELGMRQGKSIAGNIVGATANKAHTNKHNGLFPSSVWMDEYKYLPPSAFFPKPGVTDE